MLKENNSIFRKVQLAVDLVLITAAFLLAYLFRKSASSILFHPFSPLVDNIFLLYIITPLWTVLLLYYKAYDSIRSKSFLRAVLPGVKVSLTGGALLMALLFIFKFQDISRGLIAAFIAINALIFFLERAFLYFFFRHIRKYGRNFRSLLIIGTNNRACEFNSMIERHRGWGLRTIGFIDMDPKKAGTAIMGKKVLGTFEDIPNILTNEHVDEIVFVGPMSWYDHIENLIVISEGIGVKLRIVCDFFPVKNSKISFDMLSDCPLLTISPPPHYGELIAIKRAFDIVFSLAVLTLLLPLFLLIAIAIKLTSQGSVFFKQVRCGMNGRKFNLIKFRTMVKNANGLQEDIQHLNEMTGPVFKIRNDPRITPIGKFLRKFSLDELPQFINVLKGDMSIVGPRPPIPGEVDRYDYWQRRRLSVRPGLTCIWQVNGRNKIGFSDWVKLDLEYIDRWSLMLDVKIILKTIPAVLRGTGI